MIQLLVIADDFTGALDTGIQFVKKGIYTQIETGKHPEQIHISEEVVVLVLNLETRPLSSKDAYNQVAEAVKWAKKAGISKIYKKTDSALRGNIGSELTAVLDAYGGSSLYFIPAFPRMGRYTREGVQFLEGVPLAQTSFGRDLYEPITCSYIPELISRQSSVKTISIKRQEPYREDNVQKEKTIYIFDAEDGEDIRSRLAELREMGGLSLMAGCAGCAEYLTEILGLKGDVQESYARTDKLLICCGSLNPITKKQLDYLENKGIARIHLTEEQRTNPLYLDSGRGRFFLSHLAELCRDNKVVVIDTLDGHARNPASGGPEDLRDKNQLRFLVAGCQGRIIKGLLERIHIDTVLMTGGDTLMGFLKEIENPELTPICELNQGTVLSGIQAGGRRMQVISKSGGFGKEEILEEIIQEIVK